MLNNMFEFTLGDTHIDVAGNYSFTEIHLPNNLSIMLGFIYAPNQDNPNFITGLAIIIENFENLYIILADDWNSTRSFAIDNLNYRSQNNLRMTNSITRLCQISH